LHINCHSLDEEHYYFPAEIAALEFNLKQGLLRTYHQVIGICKYIKYSNYTEYIIIYIIYIICGSINIDSLA